MKGLGGFINMVDEGMGGGFINMVDEGRGSLGKRVE